MTDRRRVVRRKDLGYPVYVIVPLTSPRVSET